MNDNMWHTLALLTALVQQAPEQRLGRTALMKLLFLLTAVRDVPTGYRFRMYTYGPFDAEVLSDVDYAARLDALSVEIERYPNGYGYQIELGAEAEAIMDRARPFLSEYQEDIGWVTENFASRSAGELELLSTIVYVNREHGVSSLDEMVDIVNDIKPRFTKESIRQEVERLQETGVDEIVRLVRSKEGRAPTPAGGK